MDTLFNLMGYIFLVPLPLFRDIFLVFFLGLIRYCMHLNTGIELTTPNTKNLRKKALIPLKE